MRIQTSHQRPLINNKFHKLYKKKISCSLPVLGSYQRISPRQWLCEIFRSIILFLGEELLVHLPKTNLEERSLLAVCGCLFNISQATQLMINNQSWKYTSKSWTPHVSFRQEQPYHLFSHWHLVRQFHSPHTHPGLALKRANLWPWYELLLL